MTVISEANLFLKAIYPYNMPWKVLNVFAVKLHFPLSTNFFLHSQKQKSSEDEGWVYARLPHLTYHCTKRSLDFARQRRWQRRLKHVDEDAISLPVFHFGLKEVRE